MHFSIHLKMFEDFLHFQESAPINTVWLCAGGSWWKAITTQERHQAAEPCAWHVAVWTVGVSNSKDIMEPYFSFRSCMASSDLECCWLFSIQTKKTTGFQSGRLLAQSWNKTQLLSWSCQLLPQQNAGVMVSWANCLAAFVHSDSLRQSLVCSSHLCTNIRI